jgi:hypothetical protein
MLTIRRFDFAIWLRSDPGHLARPFSKHIDVPLTAERVWQAIASARNG